MQQTIKSKRIKVIFTYPVDDRDVFRLFLSEEARCFLKNGFEYDYSETTTIKDLFQYILELTEPGPLNETDDYLCGKILGVCNGVKEVLLLSFPLEQYVRINAINNKIVLFYQIGVGGSANILGLAKITIHSNEQNHIGRPHIHLTKPYGKSATVIIDLEILQPINMQQKRLFDRIFTKTQQDEIMFVLSRYKDNLIQYYYKSQQGINDGITFTIVYKGKEYMFK